MLKINKKIKISKSVLGEYVAKFTNCWYDNKHIKTAIDFFTKNIKSVNEISFITNDSYFYKKHEIVDYINNSFDQIINIIFDVENAEVAYKTQAFDIFSNDNHMLLHDKLTNRWYLATKTNLNIANENL